MPRESDYAIQKLREDNQLLASLRAYITEYVGTIMESVISRDAHDDILRAQGAIRGLRLFSTRLQNTVHPNDQKQVERRNGTADQS